eukprot:6199340-Pleurochrysis_carterae.AAC.2
MSEKQRQADRREAATAAERLQFIVEDGHLGPTAPSGSRRREGGEKENRPRSRLAHTGDEPGNSKHAIAVFAPCCPSIRTHAKSYVKTRA